MNWLVIGLYIVSYQGIMSLLESSCDSLWRWAFKPANLAVNSYVIQHTPAVTIKHRGRNFFP